MNRLQQTWAPGAINRNEPYPYVYGDPLAARTACTAPRAGVQPVVELDPGRLRGLPPARSGLLGRDQPQSGEVPLAARSKTPGAGGERHGVSGAPRPCDGQIAHLSDGADLVRRKLPRSAGRKDRLLLDGVRAARVPPDLFG